MMISLIVENTICCSRGIRLPVFGSVWLFSLSFNPLKWESHAGCVLLPALQCSLGISGAHWPLNVAWNSSHRELHPVPMAAFQPLFNWTLLDTLCLNFCISRVRDLGVYCSEVQAPLQGLRMKTRYSLHCTLQHSHTLRNPRCDSRDSPPVQAHK